MAHAISHVLQTSQIVEFPWNHIDPFTPLLFGGPNTPPMNLAIILLSPYIGWDDTLHSKYNVIRWAEAALAVPYTEEVGRDVVGVLLQIASCSSLRPHVPIEIWTWFRKHSTLPPLYRRPRMSISSDTVCYIRGLGDIEIFKSYLLLAWSEHSYAYGVDEMEATFWEEFCGIGMWAYRKELVDRLDQVLGSCDQAGCYLAKGRYESLREVLQQVETEARKTLTGMLSKLSFSYKYTKCCKCGYTQSPTMPSVVLCLSLIHDFTLEQLALPHLHTVDV